MDKHQKLVNKLKGKTINIGSYDLYSYISIERYISLLENMIYQYSYIMNKDLLNGILNYIYDGCNIKIMFTDNGNMNILVIDNVGGKEVGHDQLLYGEVPIKELKKYIASAKRSHNDKKILLQNIERI